MQQSNKHKEYTSKMKEIMQIKQVEILKTAVSNNIVWWFRSIHMTERRFPKSEQPNFAKVWKCKQEIVKIENIDHITIDDSHLNEKSSTSSPGGNLVDGVPPSSCRLLPFAQLFDVQTYFNILNSAFRRQICPTQKVRSRPVALPLLCAWRSNHSAARDIWKHKQCTNFAQKWNLSGTGVMRRRIMPSCCRITPSMSDCTAAVNDS